MQDLSTPIFTLEHAAQGANVSVDTLGNWFDSRHMTKGLANPSQPDHLATHLTGYTAIAIAVAARCIHTGLDAALSCEIGGAFANNGNELRPRAGLFRDGQTFLFANASVQPSYMFVCVRPDSSFQKSLRHFGGAATVINLQETVERAHANLSSER